MKLKYMELGAIHEHGLIFVYQTKIKVGSDECSQVGRL